MPRERTITEPTRPLIAQAAAIAQQWSILRPHVPHLGLVPELVSQANGEHVRIFEEDWPILSAIDGLRSITQVAQHAQLITLQVCAGLLRLNERGLVRFREARPIPEPEPAPEPAAGLPECVLEPSIPEPSAPEPGVGFFARLIGNVPGSDPVPIPVPPPAALPPVLIEYDDILVALRS